MRSAGACDPIGCHEDAAFQATGRRPDQTREGMHSPGHPCQPCGNHADEASLGSHRVNHIGLLPFHDPPHLPQRTDVVLY